MIFEHFGLGNTANDLLPQANHLFCRVFALLIHVIQDDDSSDCPAGLRGKADLGESS